MAKPDHDRQARRVAQEVGHAVRLTHAAALAELDAEDVKAAAHILYGNPAVPKPRGVIRARLKRRGR